MTESMPDYIKEQIESAYRRGFMQSLEHVIDAIDSGVTTKQLAKYLTGPLSEWRYKTCRRLMVSPPEMPKPRKSKKDNYRSKNDDN